MCGKWLTRACKLGLKTRTSNDDGGDDDDDDDNNDGRNIDGGIGMVMTMMVWYNENK